MILKARVNFYELPEKIEPDTVNLKLYPGGDPKTNPTARASQMFRVMMEDMIRYRESGHNADAIPTYWAIKEDSTRLEIWPTPARDFYARFRYMPALKEI